MATGVLSETETQARARAIPKATRLTSAEVAGAFVVFAAWLGFFAGGILIDTKPYRLKISPGGVAADSPAPLPNLAPVPLAPKPTTDITESINAVNAAAATLDGKVSALTTAAAAHVDPTWPGWFVSCFVVLTCYLPVNLAWICVTSSALGAFGEQANLSRIPASRRALMAGNPYVSATLRGFFVYLFLLSGLLLLDDAPFTTPSQGQYVRLSGFLSLFSFVVSYQPRLFNVLIVWAFHRIQVKEGDDPAHAAIARHAQHVTHGEVHTIYNVDEHVDISKPHTSRELDGGVG